MNKILEFAGLKRKDHPLPKGKIWTEWIYPDGRRFGGKLTLDFLFEHVVPKFAYFQIRKERPGVWKNQSMYDIELAECLSGYEVYRGRAYGRDDEKVLTKALTQAVNKYLEGKDVK